jgi:DNA mismatch endonuclease (patch repair protein)
MTDELRSRTMRAVKSYDTTPERTVRSLVHRLGFRFRLRRDDLPGKPDLTFPRLHKVIFVHGCFWHGHKCARGDRPPKTNAAYWRAKIGRNVARDAVTVKALREQGWRAAIVWECELKDPARVERRLRRFLAGEER